MARMRLQKFLAHAGLCSRRQAEAWILAGRVRIDGKVADRLGVQVDPEHQQVEVDGRRVELEGKTVTVALHKPRGVVTSCRHRGEPVVTDLVDLDVRLYPVGRLDKDTTGLLLLTNDGRLHLRLTHPRFGHEKEYVVTVDRPIGDKALERLAAGVQLDGRPTLPARVQRLGPRRFSMVLTEGRNRQIRRMVRKVGCRVAALKRVRIDHLRLGRLAEGAWRVLTPRELAPWRLHQDPGGAAPSGALRSANHRPAQRSGRPQRSSTKSARRATGITGTGTRR